jgi:hypothetical protein
VLRRRYLLRKSSRRSFNTVLGPKLVNDLLVRGIQALDGMKDGASLGKLFLSHGGACSGTQVLPEPCLALLALFLATTATGATVGGITGAISGFLSGDPELTPEMATALTRARIPEAVETHLYDRLSNVESFSVSRCPGQLERPRTYFPTALQKSGVNSVVVLKLSSIAFVGIKDSGPHRLKIEMRSHLVRAKDLGEIDSRSWKYRSEGHTLAEWQADNAHLFVQELERFSEDIAQKVQNEFFAM